MSRGDASFSSAIVCLLASLGSVDSSLMKSRSDLGGRVGPQLW